jgi:hypothetical protein
MYVDIDVLSDILMNFIMQFSYSVAAETNLLFIWGSNVITLLAMMVTSS